MMTQIELKIYFDETTSCMEVKLSTSLFNYGNKIFFFFKGGKRIYLKMRLVLLIGDTEIV